MKANSLAAGSMTEALRARITGGAQVWQINRNTLYLMLAMPFIVAAAAIAMGAISKDLYKWFTGEDRFGETMQVIFYLSALVMSLVLIRRLWATEQRVMAMMYLGVAMGLFFLIGEEISWGQRIFGWATPQTLEQLNKQNETNLHNIQGVGATFKWVQMLVGAYGTILPLLVLAIGPERLGKYKKFTDWVVPHISLVPYFMCMFFWKLYRNLFEAPEKYYFAISEYNEVMEMILAMGFALFMLFQLRRMRANSAA